MGLLSDLLGKKAAQTAKDLMQSALRGAKTQPSAPAASHSPAPQAPAPAARQEEPLGPSGDSWGPVMPAEENQFNFNGPFTAYFEHVFQAEFPMLGSVREIFSGGRRAVYRFSRGGAPVLVVELLCEGSKAARQRRLCARDGIPYLRFYYNHEGWWNTRSYVARRMREAMR